MTSNWLQVIWAAIRLDVTHLAWIQSSAYHADVLETLRKGRPPTRSLALRVYDVASRLIHFFRLGWQQPHAVRPPLGAVLLIAFTKNQLASLAPIARALEERGTLACLIPSLARTEGLRALSTAAWFISLPFLPILLLRVAIAGSYARKSLRYAFGHYWQAYGLYIVVRWWLSRCQPAAVVLSNDHTLWPRTVLRVAKHLAISTLYVQHASVTAKFPPLEHDYALLDGCDALDKYQVAGPSSSRVFLIGVTKFDRATVKRAIYATDARRSGVGICCNELDPLARVKELVDVLAARLPERQLHLRPHPGSPPAAQSALRSLAANVGAKFSNAAQEPAHEFLLQVSTVLAGDSSILLEAALLGAVPIWYDFARQGKDVYGFRARKLVQRSNDPQEAVTLVENANEARRMVRERAAYFSATIGTEFEGRSADLAASIISAVADKRQPDLSDWTPIPASIIAYAPRSSLADGSADSNPPV